MGEDPSTSKVYRGARPGPRLMLLWPFRRRPQVVVNALGPLYPQLFVGRCPRFALATSGPGPAERLRSASSPAIEESKGATVRRSNQLAAATGLGLIGLAVLQERRKPPSQRSWHGHVLGFVPYDLRPPSVSRFRRAWWNPSDQRVFTERDFGVGWAVNFPSLVRFASEVLTSR
jgi:hypothetical protein